MNSQKILNPVIEKQTVIHIQVRENCRVTRGKHHLITMDTFESTSYLTLFY